MQYPGLIPFAALGQSANAEETMRQAAQRIDQIADPSTQANLMAASRILAGLKLEEDMIYRILRRDIMRESAVQFANTCIRDKDTPSRPVSEIKTLPAEWQALTPRELEIL